MYDTEIAVLSAKVIVIRHRLTLWMFWELSATAVLFANFLEMV